MDHNYIYGTVVVFWILWSIYWLPGTTVIPHHYWTAGHWRAWVRFWLLVHGSRLWLPCWTTYTGYVFISFVFFFLLCENMPLVRILGVWATWQYRVALKTAGFFPTLGGPVNLVIKQAHPLKELPMKKRLYPQKYTLHMIVSVLKENRLLTWKWVSCGHLMSVLK